MELMKWAEFYRGTDKETQLKHLDSFLEIIKFYEMKTAELQQIVRIIVRANHEKTTPCLNNAEEKTKGEKIGEL